MDCKIKLTWLFRGSRTEYHRNLIPSGLFYFRVPLFFHQKETLRKEGRYVLLNYSNSSLIRSKELFSPFLKLNDRTNERIMLTRKMSRYLSNINSKRDSFSRTYSSLYFLSISSHKLKYFYEYPRVKEKGSHTHDVRKGWWRCN